MSLIVELLRAYLVLRVLAKLWSHLACKLNSVEHERDVHVRNYSILVQIEDVILDFHVYKHVRRQVWTVVWAVVISICMEQQVVVVDDVRVRVHH